MRPGGFRTQLPGPTLAHSVLPVGRSDSYNLWSAMVQAGLMPGTGTRVLSESGNLGQQITVMLHRALFKLSLGGDSRCLPFGNPGLFPGHNPCHAGRWHHHGRWLHSLAVCPFIEVALGSAKASTGPRWHRASGQMVNAGARSMSTSLLGHLLQEPFPDHPAL